MSTTKQREHRSSKKADDIKEAENDVSFSTPAAGPVACIPIPVGEGTFCARSARSTATHLRRKGARVETDRSVKGKRHSSVQYQRGERKREREEESSRVKDSVNSGKHVGLCNLP